ncbi:unnamed protein product [Prunus armeniaca]
MGILEKQILCLNILGKIQLGVLLNKMFNKSREENERLADVEKRKLEKEAMKDRTVTNSSARKDGVK